MPFADPLVGGITLIRQAIRTPNYVPGVSGWSINVDGSAEFNNVAVRGDLLVGVSPNPRTYIGSVIPAPLAAASPDFVWRAVIIEYFDATSFRFDAIGTYSAIGTFPVRATGTYDTTNGVLFHELNQGPGSTVNAVTYGSDTYNGAPITWTWRNGTLNISTTTTLQINGDIERTTGNRGYLLTAHDYATATAALALTGVAQVVPGCQLLVSSLRANALYTATIVVALTAGSAAWTGVGQLRVNGVLIGPQALLAGNTGDFATVAQRYDGTLATAATHTFELVAARAAGAAGTAAGTHTTISVNIYE